MTKRELALKAAATFEDFFDLAKKTGNMDLITDDHINDYDSFTGITGFTKQDIADEKDRRASDEAKSPLR